MIKSQNGVDDWYEFPALFSHFVLAGDIGILLLAYRADSPFGRDDQNGP